MSIISKLRVTLGLDSSQYKKGLKKATKETGHFSKMVKDAGVMISGYFGFQALIAGIRNVIKVNKEFEKSLSTLQSITGVSSKEMKYYAEQAKFLGETTTQTGSQVAKAFTLIGSKMPVLLKSKEALVEVTKQAIILAEAANIDVPQAATAMTNSLNQMGKGAESASEFINILAAGSKVGAADIPYLNAAIEKAGGAAQSTGINFNELTGAIETIAPSIAEPTTAGLQLRQIFLRLQKGADEFNPSVVGLSKALHNLKGEQLSANEILQKFGIINFTAAKALITNADAYDTYTNAVTGTNTALEQQATNIENLDGDLDQLSSSWEGLTKVDTGAMRSMTQLLTRLVREASGADLELAGIDLAKKAFVKLEKTIDEEGGNATLAMRGAMIGLEVEHSRLNTILKAKTAETKGLGALAANVITGGYWSTNARREAQVQVNNIIEQKKLLQTKMALYNQKEVVDLQKSELKKLDIKNKSNAELDRLSYSSSTADFVKKAIIEEQQTRANAAQDAIRNIKNLSAKVAELNIQRKTATGDNLIGINNEITALKKEIAVLKDLKFVAGSIKPISLDASVTSPMEVPPLQGPEINGGKPQKLVVESSYINESNRQHIADMKATQEQVERTASATEAYGSILGSVGTVINATGTDAIHQWAGITKTVISSVSAMIPVLFKQSVAGAVAGAASAPWFVAPAVIATNVASVVSAFSGIGGGSASTSTPTTRIDTRQLNSPNPTVNKRRSTTNQNINVNVTGEISNRTIALSAKKGQNEINR